MIHRGETMVSRLALVFSVSLGGLLGTTMLSWWRGSELLKPVTELLAASEVEAAEPEPDDTESLRLVLSLPVSGSQRQAGTTELKRAQTLARSGNAQGAQGGYERSAELFPQFADWAHMLAAGTAAGRGDTASVADLLGRIGPQMALEWGWRHRVTALRNAGDTTAALMVAERLAGELEGARRADA